MCANIPGLIFSSICVHILELNKFPRSVTVCPRIEVDAKKERWQITYICSSLSTVLPTMPMAMMMMAMPPGVMTGASRPVAGPMMMAMPPGVMTGASRPVAGPMMPGVTMTRPMPAVNMMGQPMTPVVMQGPKPAMATPTAGQMSKPPAVIPLPVAPPGMPMGQMISPGATSTPQKIPGTTMMQKPAVPGMVQMAASSAMPAIISRPMMAGTPAMVQLQMPGMRPAPAASAQTMMGQLPMATRPAIMMVPLMPSSAPTMVQMPVAAPKTAVLPVDGMRNSSLRRIDTSVDELSKNLLETQRESIMLTEMKRSYFDRLSASRRKRPLLREISKRELENNEEKKVPQVESTIKSFQINTHSMNSTNKKLFTNSSHNFQQMTINRENNGIILSDLNTEKLLYGNQSIFSAINNTQNLNSEKLTGSTATEKNVFLSYLKREKRNVDMFDLLHQANKCERAYRICITRSKQFIVSRLNKPRVYGPIKNIDCSNKPAKIVHGLNENLCSNPPILNYFTESPLSVSANAAVSPGDKKPSIQINDSLQAIIVHDESSEGSDTYSQNDQHIIPLSSYNRTAIFPSRTPPFIVSQMGQLFKASRYSNDTFLSVGESGNYSWLLDGEIKLGN